MKQVEDIWKSRCEQWGRELQGKRVDFAKVLRVQLQEVIKNLPSCMICLYVCFIYVSTPQMGSFIVELTIERKRNYYRKGNIGFD